jgi:1-acyl-sn-glycerol-3-phosphate acyltransferase
MMFIRSLVFVVWLYGMMALFGTGMLLLLPLPRRLTMRAIALYAQTVRFGLKHICGTEIEIRGRENLPAGPVIYAGKHHCMYDVFVPFLVTSDPAIVLKRELVFYPFLGWYALKANMIPIDRDGTTKTLKKMIAAAQQRVAQGRQIVIFPEGTRMPVGAPPDYKAAGVSAFNKALGLPIVPVATNAGLCWPSRGVLRTPGRIVYAILPPIPAGLDRRTLMSRLENTLETATNDLIAEGRAAQGHTAPRAGDTPAVDPA